MYLSIRKWNRIIVLIFALLAIYYCGWWIVWRSPRLFAWYASSRWAPEPLHTSIVSNVVYVAWCSQQYFEFKHYLSVKSVFATIRPFHVVLVYERLPRADLHNYNSWLDELRREQAWLRVERAPVSICSAYDRVDDVKMLQYVMWRGGGVYVRNDVILTPKFLDIINVRSGNFVATDKNLNVAVVHLHSRRIVDALLTDSISNGSLRCDSFINSKVNSPCISVDGTIYPRDVWTRDDWLGGYIRKIFYGSSDLATARRDPTSLAPNIAHLTWFGGDQVYCNFYVAVLSLIYFGKVDRVLIHLDVEPEGDIWPLVKAERKVEVVHRAYHGSVFEVRPKRVAHNMDIVRNDIMFRYGGIYVDTDVVFLAPLSEDQRSYDASISHNWATHFYPNYPDHLINGVLVGKANAEFWRVWLAAIRTDFRDDIWSYAGCLLSYKLKERHPTLIRIDPRLQLACYLGHCYPTNAKFGGGVPQLPSNVSVDELIKNFNSIHFTAFETGLFPEFMTELWQRVFEAAGKRINICDVKD